MCAPGEKDVTDAVEERGGNEPTACARPSRERHTRLERDAALVTRLGREWVPALRTEMEEAEAKEQAFCLIWLMGLPDGEEPQRNGAIWKGYLQEAPHGTARTNAERSWAR